MKFSISYFFTLADENTKEFEKKLRKKNLIWETLHSINKSYYFLILTLFGGIKILDGVWTK